MAERSWKASGAFAVVIPLFAAYAVPAAASAGGEETNGPDVIVARIDGVTYHGVGAGGIVAFSFGTTVCNVGDTASDWIADTNRHPVISQSMFRLKEGRFEQIGLSWLKHGFFATSGTFCTGGLPCNGDPSGTHLGAGCSDVYSAFLNGQQGNMSPRGIMDPYTGYFDFPYSAPASPAVIGRRLQAEFTDISVLFNPDALYFLEGHIVSPDDAEAGNQDDNASYRRIRFSGSESVVFISVVAVDATEQQKVAVRAWKDNDPQVAETEIRVPDDGLLILAAKATHIGGGIWNYEYALQNLNSDRAVGVFSVPVVPSASVAQIGFHDVFYHSGELIDGTDWDSAFVDGNVIWATQPYETNPDANAVRWGTLYNFRFHANVAPQATSITLGFFKPGAPATITAPTIGPFSPLPDCNGNGIDDACDVECGPPGGPCDFAGCGQSPDLNANGVPDECDLDCNGNDVPDDIDIDEGLSDDCDGNTVPDECEADSDFDGTIDACDVCPLDADDDADGDGTCAPQDQCPSDPGKTDPGQCGCGTADSDGDLDGIVDCIDNCEFLPNPAQEDADGDGVGDACDNCPDVPNAGQADADGDQSGDACDPCPLEFPNDADGDGLCAPDDACPQDPAKYGPELCGCGVPDDDADGDGAPDCVDECPFDPQKSAEGVCGCGHSEQDSDADGVPDCVDACPGLNDTIDNDENGSPDCAETVPAVSRWGLLVLALALLACAKLANKPLREKTT